MGESIHIGLTETGTSDDGLPTYRINVGVGGPLAVWRDIALWGLVDTGVLLLYRCPACGSITDEPYTHREWHDRTETWR